jgi:hypothetical protein
MAVDLLGRASVDAILKSPTIIPPLPSAPVRAALTLTALVVALAIVFLPMGGIATAVLLALLVIAGKPSISYVRDRFMNRHEPSRPTLLATPFRRAMFSCLRSFAGRSEAAH